MRRSAWIFLAAILLPSLALAWLAVRSARDQQVLLEHQQAIISQDITDALAKKVQGQLDGSRSAFVQTTQQLLQKSSSPSTLAKNFNHELQSNWNLAEIGFAVDLNGTIYSPTPNQGTVAKTFRTENSLFLGNRENVPVFSQYPQQAASANATQNVNNAVNAPPPQMQAQNAPPPQTIPQQIGANRRMEQVQRQLIHAQEAQQAQTAPPPEAQSGNEAQMAQVQQQAMRSADVTQLRNAAQQSVQSGNEMAQAEQVQRQVIPQKNFLPQQSTVSTAVPAESDFRRVIGTESTGALARFLEDKLRLMVWYRPPTAGSLVFGAQISQPNLIRSLQPLLQSPELHRNADATYCLALLDDRGNPVALSKAGFKADWKHPFVATEIGEALPHWEAALYLVDPQQINRSASTLQFTLGFIVLALMAAIVFGGWLMAADVRRKMLLAQQKTDFVSNVSHELKTPLTSIRMFADMLAEGRVAEPDRQANYLRIISAESARLTRLINNVLDFARMERGAPSGERRSCDLVEIVREVVDTCRPHLETVGVALGFEITLDNTAEALPLVADRDALAQVVLNLLSNAEKYGGHEILVRVRWEKQLGSSGSGCVDVLDRGPGIPPKKLDAIFQPFHRLDDSLASGVSGSGLGLTLARRMARDNGGDVTYSPRAGGGSCFTLTVPLSTAAQSNDKPNENVRFKDR
ncbi:MAG TPA: ATP-binding protein [Terriglobales bacterium]|nr:ATP-binding protein [Terriglobales bacterium]